MRQVSLAQLLKRQRGDRSLREMARRTGLSVMAVRALEEGETLLPKQDTLAIIAAVYDIPEDDLALAVYGLYFEPDPAPAVPV